MIKKYSMPQNFDIIVAGGGLSGCMAAISAAREGKSVLLIEKNGYLGGMATSALVNPFMRYYRNETLDIEYYSGGLFLEMVKNLEKMGAAKKNVFAFCDETLKLVLDRMLSENKVNLLLHAFVSDVKVNDGIIESLEVCTHTGKIMFSAKVFIDATGNADLSAFAGAKYKQGRDSDGLCQPMTTCFRIGNIDWSKFDRKAATEKYNEFQLQGKIKNPRENILVFRLLNPQEDLIMHVNSTRIIAENPVDALQLTLAEKEGREQVFELFNFLKENCDGCQKAFLLQIASEIGIRESRRIVGYTEIKTEDLLTCKKFEDSIARGIYGIDIHSPSGSGTTIKEIAEDDYYTIPYSAMIPVSLHNVIVSGRPISSTHEAHSAFRIMPITSCMGEAAGIAASLSIDYNTKPIDVNIKQLHKKLDIYNAIY